MVNQTTAKNLFICCQNWGNHMKNIINTTFMVNQTTVHQYAAFFHSPSSVGKVAKLSEISILKHDG